MEVQICEYFAEALGEDKQAQGDSVQGGDLRP